MLTNIEGASFYLLKPIDALEKERLKESPIEPSKIVEDAIPVGGMYVMNEVAVYMSNEDVIATVGTYPDTCIVITDIPRSRCIEIIAKGKEIFDRKIREAMKENG